MRAFDPKRSSGIEMPQRSSLPSWLSVLSFQLEAREVSVSEPARVDHATRRRGSLAASGAGAAAGDAGDRLQNARDTR